MGRKYQSSLHGQNSEWRKTIFPELRPRSGEPSRQYAARIWDLLGNHYWGPVYCCLRRSGISKHDAEDLTSGFFLDVVLPRRLAARADPAKGRFRDFLRRALRNYVVDQQRAGRLDKAVQLDETDDSAAPDLADPVDEATPADRVIVGLARELLFRVIRDVECQCRNEGLGGHWSVFNSRILQPIMNDTKPPGMDSICREHNIPNSANASNMIVTVVRRFRATLREHIRPHVDSEQDVLQEIQDWIGLLCNNPG